MKEWTHSWSRSTAVCIRLCRAIRADHEAAGGASHLAGEVDQHVPSADRKGDNAVRLDYPVLHPCQERPRACERKRFEPHVNSAALD